MQAVFVLRALKALGLDGFNGIFYQKYWEVVKETVVKAVKRVLLEYSPYH